MVARITQVSGADAYDLIYAGSISKLPESAQATMYTYMLSSADVWAGFDDDKILCVWGLIPPTLLSDRAYLWLFVTENMHEHQFVFVRHSQTAIAKMLTKYPLIIGHCAVGAEKSIRWLRWLGAIFSEPQGRLIPFEIRARHG